MSDHALTIDGGTTNTLTGILTTAAGQGIAGDINVHAPSISITNLKTSPLASHPKHL